MERKRTFFRGKQRNGYVAIGTLMLTMLMLVLFPVCPVLAGPGVDVTLEAEEITVGETVRLAIAVNGSTQAHQPEVPDTDGLEIRYLGPSTQFQIINGQSSSSITHNYTVTAVRAGVYTLGPFTVRTGGKVITTRSVKLTVTTSSSGGYQATGDSGDSGEGGKNEEIFIELDIPKTRIYIGEKIPVKIRFCTARRVSEISYPAFDQPAFFMDKEKMKEYKERQRVIKGQVYQIYEFPTTLTPLKIGKMDFPVKVTCNVIVRNNRYRDPFFDDFFNDYEKQPIEINAPKTTIQVLPLPEEGKPANFSGGIGEFQLQAIVNPTEVLQGDPITVTLMVSGQGNFETLGAPTLRDAAGFKVYDPRRKPSANHSTPTEVIFEQVLIPLEAGNHEIPPYQFSYFDAVTGSYRLIATSPIPLNIKSNPDFKNGASGNGSDDGGSIGGEDLVYIKAHPGRFVLGGAKVYHHFGFWLGIILPLIGLGLAWFFKNRYQMLQADTPKARAIRAGTKAEKEMARLGKMLDGADGETVVEDLHRVLREFLGEKFNLTAAGITGQVVEVLRERDVSVELLQEISRFFDQYDFYRFTGAKVSNAFTRECWEKVRRIIEGLNLPLKRGTRSRMSA